jgi:hypothetical protein
MAFDPGLTQSDAPATRQNYPDGDLGIRLSLEEMAKRIREGRLDPAVRGWAIGALKDAGIDGRGRTTVRAQVGALLDALRKQTSYAGDPAGAEYIASAAATLCLRPGLCLNGGDCDDLSVALGAAIMSIGIPAVIVKQSFGPNAQEHVLVAAQDEAGAWIYADPSTRLPIGSASAASEEVWIDPLAPIGQLPEAQAEIVSLGAPRRLQQIAGRWVEERSGHVWLHRDGVWHSLGVARPNGLGLIFGNHTANELQVDLINWQGFVATMATAVAESGDKWKSADAAAYDAWLKDWTTFRANWDPAADRALKAIADATNSFLGRDWTSVEDVYQATVTAYHPLDDLVRRWMAASKAPTPQFQVSLDPNAAADADLIAYQGADKIIKSLENAAKPIQDPAKFGLMVFLAGAATAVVTIVVIKKVL